MIRFGFWRRPKPGQLTVDVLQQRLEQEAEAAAAEKDQAAREANESTMQLPEFDFGLLPRWVRRKQMLGSARYDGTEVTP